MWQCDRMVGCGKCDEDTGCVGAGKDLMEGETDTPTPLYLPPMALLASAGSFPSTLLRPPFP